MPLFWALLAVSSAQAQPIRVFVDAGRDCPDRATMEAALTALGFAVVDGEAALRLDLGKLGDDLAVRLQSGGGASLLERFLPTDDCAVLAETVALLVSRRVRGVRWRAPEPEPPATPAPAPAPPPTPEPVAPSWTVDAGAGVLYASGFAGHGALGPIALGVLRPPGPFHAALDAAWIHHDDVPAGTGAVDATRLPVGLAAGASIGPPTWKASLDARIELETLIVESHGVQHPERRARVSLRAGPRIGVWYSLAGPLWLAVSGSAALLLQGYRFLVDTDALAQDFTAVEVAATLAWRL